MGRDAAFLAIALLVMANTVQAQGLNTTASVNWTGAGAIFTPKTAGSTRYNYADAVVVTLGNGTYRMYYSNFTEPVGQYNTQGSEGWVDSATSLDGINWKPEPGHRITNPNGPCPPYQGSAIQFANGTVRLYTGCGTYQSQDGLSFSRMMEAPRIAMPNNYQMAGPPQILLLANGTYKAYAAAFVSGDTPLNGVTEILSYKSGDGFTFAQETGTRIGTNVTFEGYALHALTHPLVYRLENGDWIMYLDTGTLTGAAGGAIPANPTAIFTSKDGMNWTPSNLGVPSSETYGVLAGGSNSVLVFGYYGTPQVPMPSYAGSNYGGGLYYARPSAVAAPNQTIATTVTTTTSQTGNPTVPASTAGSAQGGSALPYAAVIVVIVAAGAYYALRGRSKKR